MRARESIDPRGRTSKPRRCIIFLHVPKTAGSTLKAALRHKYPSATVLLGKTSDPLGGIGEVPLADRRTARVVTGHVHYGVHRHIPQQCEYVTVLREPVTRVLSMYRDILTHPKHRLHDELTRSAMGVEEFARTVVDPGLDNLQTRLISGSKPGEVVAQGAEGRVWLAPELEVEDLEEAKRNLDRFLVVGLTERFDESFILISRALGWRLPMYVTRNIAKPADPRSERPSTEAIELIRERNQLDAELYDHAVALFSAAVDRQGSSFGRKVAAFKVANRIPNRIGPRVPAPLRHPLRALFSR